MQIPDDYTPEPVFYTDEDYDNKAAGDTEAAPRSHANANCPRCSHDKHNVVAFGPSNFEVVYYGCRNCFFRWQR
eukprot:gene28860-32048_t